MDYLSMLLGIAIGVVIFAARVAVINRRNAKYPRTDIFECRLAGCRHHNGEFVACDLKNVVIDADGNCEQADMLTDHEALNKCGGSVSKL